MEYKCNARTKRTNMDKKEEDELKKAQRLWELRGGQ